MSPEEFRRDLRRARVSLEQAAGAPVLGFRAPSYSITRESLWALDVLAEEGYAYDASIFPVHHDRYGIPSAPRHPHILRTPNGLTILEVPASTVRCAGVNLPIAGGGYFRQLPFGWTHWGVARLNTVEHKPAIFYLHPWEIDPEQPRVESAPWLRRVRHYRNLHRTEPRLRQLLRDFRFDCLASVVGLSAASTPGLAAAAI
jgi:polysaccharide deacetylase family protein (PEP-CTERM system associated)